MLGGLAPIFLFKFGELPSAVLSENPILQQFKQSFLTLGLPIPIYLDERLTDLYVDTETKNIDLETEVFTREVLQGPKIRQKGLNSSITINLISTRDSVMATILIGLLDLIFPRVSTLSYSLSYFNGNTFILDGLLQGFALQSESNDNLLRLAITISKAAERSVTQDRPSTVPKTIASDTSVAGALQGD